MKTEKVIYNTLHFDHAVWHASLINEQQQQQQYFYCITEVELNKKNNNNQKDVLMFHTLGLGAVSTLIPSYHFHPLHIYKAWCSIAFVSFYYTELIIKTIRIIHGGGVVCAHPPIGWRSGLTNDFHLMKNGFACVINTTLKWNGCMKNGLEV